MGEFKKLFEEVLYEKSDKDEKDVEMGKEMFSKWVNKKITEDDFINFYYKISVYSRTKLKSFIMNSEYPQFAKKIKILISKEKDNIKK